MIIFGEEIDHNYNPGPIFNVGIGIADRHVRFQYEFGGDVPFDIRFTELLRYITHSLFYRSFI